MTSPNAYVHLPIYRGTRSKTHLMRQAISGDEHVCRRMERQVRLWITEPHSVGVGENDRCPAPFHQESAHQLRLLAAHLSESVKVLPKVPVPSFAGYVRCQYD